MILKLYRTYFFEKKSALKSGLKIDEINISLNL